MSIVNRRRRFGMENCVLFSNWFADRDSTWQSFFAWLNCVVLIGLGFHLS